MTDTLRSLCERLALGLLFLSAAILLAGSPASGGAEPNPPEQGVGAEVTSQVSWGSDDGCVQNIQTNDFGELTPGISGSLVGSFAATPEPSASIDGEGNHVWVGCVTSNGPLVSIVAQGAQNMHDSADRILPLSDVAIGLTNRPGGKPPAGCGITSGQQTAGACTLPADASTVRPLVGELPAGTTELDWQYQLNLPSSQPPGVYTGGEVIFTATASAPEPLPAPSNLTIPQISPPTPKQGSSLSTTEGTWSNSPTAYAYQWERCNEAGENCGEVAGATEAHYTPTAADVAQRLRVRVTASNSGGEATTYSAPSEPVQAAVPQNTLRPSISPTGPQEGVAEHLSIGSWTNNPTTYAYQWERCDEAGENCTAISGANNTEYSPVAADTGHTLAATVTATNSGGSTSASAPITEVVAVAPPTAGTPLPQISGTMAQGHTISTTNGTFGGGAVGTYTYRWRDCDENGENCVDIAGATQSTYTLSAAEVGHTLLVQVTATNTAGSATEISPSTKIIGGPPINTEPPVLASTTPAVGVQDSVSTGTWTESPTSFAYQWQLCNSSGEGCIDIFGAEASTFTPTSTDAGHTLRAEVTADGEYGTGSALSDTSGVTSESPQNVHPPVLSSEQPVEGEELSVSSGTWSGTPESFIYTYQWLRCDTAGEHCVVISGASFASYTAVAADVGHTLIARVIASNTAGMTSALSERSDEVLPGVPVSLSPPSLSPTTPQQGVSELASNGSWSENPTAYAYQWERCNGLGVACLPVAGANSQTYTPTAEDIGDTLVVEVTASNSGGSASASSSASNVVVPAAPVNTLAPSYTPATPQQGVPEGVSEGTWTNSPTSFAYQWEQCNATGGECSSISGATSSTYTPVAADVGHRLRAKVTATNAGGSASEAPVTPVVLPAAPANSVLPVISPVTPHQGTVEFTTNGTWSGSPTSFFYQWQDCNSSGESCSNIAGATSANYMVVAGDIGDTLRVQVTATGAGGSATASSEATATALPAVPANTALPVISPETPVVGVPETTTTGSWLNSPTSYAYQWRHCNSTGESCTGISGATASSYTPQPSDAGFTLVVEVRASNAGGGFTVVSKHTNAVTQAPSETSLPALSTSDPTEGVALSVSNGAWVGYPAPTYVYQWQRCNAFAGECVNIAGATSSSYTPVEADVSETIQAIVKATNSAGSASATTAASNIVTGVPVNTQAPSLSSTAAPVEGTPIGVSTGTWGGYPTPTYTYQWLRCNGSGESCANITGATSSSYTPVSADVAHTLQAKVTATNTVGSSSASTTASISVLPLPPASTAAPVISNTAPQQGVSDSVSSGTWTNSPTSFSYQWEDCNGSGEGCANITGATSSSYTPVAGDVSHTLRVVVTATNAGGTGTATSGATQSVLPAVPVNSVAPSISSSSPTVGALESATTGTWSNSPTSFTYQWEDCNGSGESCVSITGASGSTYTPQPSDAGHTLVVDVSASNSGGSAAAVASAHTNAVTQAPSETVLPVLSTSSPTEGASLSVSTGTWNGYPAPTYAYQWQRCNSLGGECANISGATGSGYTPVAADVSNTIRAIVTASNSVGNASAATLTSNIVTGAPANTAAPSLSSTTPVEGTSLSVSSGTWAGYPVPTYAYQWEDCNGAGESCANISGATSSSYTPLESDVGHTLRTKVTASNSVGSSSASTTASKAVLPLPPANTTAPSISPSAAQQGVVESTTNGVWSKNPTSYSYQWEDCNGAGESCTNISGATSSSYTPVESDVGHTLRVKVTASNTGGSTSASSGATQSVLPAVPVNSVAPSISSSSPTVGVLESATNGTWSNSPTSFAYHWFDCNGSGGECSTISGATSFSYTPVAADAGHTLVVDVSASNAGGSSAAAASAHTNAVTQAPSETALPALSSNSPTEGVSLSVSNGTWVGFPAPTYTYQWQRCNSFGGECANISGATSSGYTPVVADVGGTIQAVVKASNSVGSASATTLTSSIVTGAPANTAAPSLSSGSPVEGVSLSVSPGGWRGYPPPTYTYQWLRCNSSGGSCTHISGATSSSYTPVAADVGQTLKAEVTGTNSVGSSSASTTASAVVVPPPPGNSSPPVISPTSPQQGVLESTTNGTWSNSPTSFTYQWEDCNSAGESCANISGALSSSYTPVATDVGDTLRVAVTATNAGGHNTATASQTSVVLPAPPANLSAPVISPTSPQQGVLESATNGTWSNSPTSFAYQWEDCNSAGESCTNISGATSSSYTPVEGDVGHTLRVKVTASNTGGSTSATSGATSGVLPAAPVNSVLPSLSPATAQQGVVESTTNGTWSNNPTSFSYQWEDCNSAGESCTNISGATSATYTPVASDSGHTLRVIVTATNTGGHGTATSNATKSVLPPAPVNTAAPTITPTAPVQGTVETAANGTWSNSPTSFAYQWERCTSLGTSCLGISGATSSTYTPVAADVGSTLVIQVTATNTGGSTPAVSSATSVVLGPPVNTAVPALSSPSPEVGVLETVTTGTWTESPTSYTYKWEDCNSAGEGCTAISGATSASYTPVTGDVGERLIAVVTASNSRGTGSPAASSASLEVGVPVINTVAGSGSATYSGDGEPATTAGFAGTDDVAVDSAGNIYIAETAGDRIRKVTASTGKISTIAGSGTAGFSGDGGLATAAVIDRPVSLAVDSSGNVYIADTGNERIREITASTGKISTIAGNGTAAFSGDGSAATSAEIDDPEGVAVDSAGNVYIADTENFRIREVSASTGKISTIAGNGTDGYNGDGILGTAAEISPPEGVAVDSAGNVYIADDSNHRVREVSAATGKISTVAGNGTSGFTGDGGAANAAEISTAYGLAVDGAGNVYVDDTGNARIREVTALTGKITTVAGTGTVGFSGDGGPPTSAELALSYGIAADSAGDYYIDENTNHRIREVSIARPPLDSTLPALSTNAPQQGVSLSTSNGTWSNGPTSFTYQWERCNTSGASCVSISGATSSSYTPVEADVGHTLRAQVTASNSAGSRSATSTFGNAVLPAPPVLTTAPTLSTGTPVRGVSLSTSTGAWTNSPTTFTYKWLRCNSAGESCVSISGATSSSYTPVAADVNETLEAQVTAANSGGSGSPALTTASATVREVPSSATLPVLSTETPEQNVQMSVGNGTWNGVPATFTYAYQWLRCNSAGESCVAIGGATNSTYIPVLADVGNTLAAQVTATNTAGTSSPAQTASSEAVVAAPPPPANTELPTITPSSPKQAVAESTTTGTWSNSPTGYTYQWEDCNTAGESCASISGATSSSYTPVAADVGHTLRVVVTASNVGGPGSATSAATATVLPPAPGNTVLPVISPSSPQQSIVESTTNGTWTNTPTSFAYQWERCNSAGESCTSIGTSSSSYTPVEADITHTLRVKVTATNAGGSTGALSAATAVVTHQFHTQSIDSGSSLNAVSCIAASADCVVSDSKGNAFYDTAVKLTTSGTWTSWSGPGTSPSYALDCPSTTLCLLADGTDEGGRAGGSLYYATGFGGGWTLAYTPSYGVDTISCTSSTFCLDGQDSEGYYRFSTMPNSVDWTLQQQGTATTSSVYCLTSSFCAIADGAGNVRVAPSTSQIESSSWTLTDVDGTTALNEITCTSTTSCLAVDGVGDVLNLTISGTGAATVVKHDIDGTNDLTGITCTTSSSCVATDSVGNIFVSINNGSTWVKQYALSDDLTGVSCASATLCVAVDSTGNVISFEA